MVTSDKTTVVGEVVPHPEYRFQAPYDGRVTTRTPGGLTRVDETIIIWPNAEAPGAEGSGVGGSGGAPSDEPKVVRTRVNGGAWGTTDVMPDAVVVVTPQGRTQTTRLNSRGQPTAVEVPGNLTAHAEYYVDGSLRRVWLGEAGAEQRTLDYYYDDPNLIARVVDSLHTTELRLDKKRRPKQISLPGGGLVQLAFDQNDNLTGIVPPERDGQELFGHEMLYKGGVLLEQYIPPPLLSNVPVATKRFFDADGALDHISYPDNRTLEVGYDAHGRVHTINDGETATTILHRDDTGQVASISRAGETISFDAYDGPLLKTESWTGSVEGVIQRLYDAAFQLSTETINGRSVGYAYDADGLPTHVGDAVLTWHPANGRLERVAVENVKDEYHYSSLGEADWHGVTITADAQAPYFTEEVTRDPLGRVATKTETVGSTSSTWRYTYWHRGWLRDVTLVKPNGDEVVTYEYDANGNRLGATAYDAQDRLESRGSRTYQYGNRGDLMTVTEPPDQQSGPPRQTQFRYDLSGALQYVDLPDDTVIEYVLDPLGRRIAKRRNGVFEDRFIYRTALQPALWVDKDNRHWRLVYALGGNVPDYMTDGTKTYRLVTDRLRSLRLVVDVIDGTIVQRMAYDAWGVPTEDSAVLGWVKVPFGFGGGIYDRDTGLVRFGARDYDPSIGRWTTKDPLLFGGGDTNLYLYAGGDPVNRVDPSGQFILPALWAAVDAAAILLGFGASAPSDTAAVPANVWGMIFSVLPLKGLPGLGGARGGGPAIRVGTLPPGFLGETDAVGRITIAHASTLKAEALARGIPFRQVVRETIRHEMVHRFFSPASPGFRASFRMLAREHSSSVRYLEEGLAEGIATRSVGTGLSFPISAGYVTRGAVLVEGAGYLGILGAGYGTAGYLWWSQP